jgi:thiol-disulfide isomerase/thioredoxin
MRITHSLLGLLVITTTQLITIRPVVAENCASRFRPTRFQNTSRFRVSRRCVNDTIGLRSRVGRGPISRPTPRRSTTRDFENSEFGNRTLAIPNDRRFSGPSAVSTQNSILSNRNVSPTRAVPNTVPPNQSSRLPQQSATVKWHKDFGALARPDRNLIVKFEAPWCGACQQMNRETITNRDVISMIKGNFIAVSINVDENKKLVDQLQIESIPTVLLMSPQGKILRRAVGYQTPDKLLRLMEPHRRNESLRRAE